MPLPMTVYERKNELRRLGTRALRKVHKKHRIIASLTSYPPRIGTVHMAIQSLLAQKCLPDLVVLWLYRGDFPNGEADLPRELRRKLSFDVQIKWVDHDLKPHKKYFWALQEFSDDLVITFDDDLVYPNTLIAELLEAYQAFPDCIISARTHLMTFGKEGQLLPYSRWILEAPLTMPNLVKCPSMKLFATSGAGTLFPPHIMPVETFDMNTIKKLCIGADDVWLKCMQMISEIPVVATAANQALTYIPNTQDIALCNINLGQGGNDVYLNQVLQYCSHLYPDRDFIREIQISS